MLYMCLCKFYCDNNTKNKYIVYKAFNIQQQSPKAQQHECAIILSRLQLHVCQVYRLFIHTYSRPLNIYNHCISIVVLCSCNAYSKAYENLSVCFYTLYRKKGVSESTCKKAGICNNLNTFNRHIVDLFFCFFFNR